MKSFTIDRYLILVQTFALCIALAFPTSIYGSSQKKFKFISYEVWQTLSDTEKKEIIKKIQAIPYPKQRTSSSTSKRDYSSTESSSFLFRLVVSIESIGSMIIPQAMAYSPPEDRTQYNQLEREYNNKCGSSGRPKTCDQLADILETYEFRALPNGPSKKRNPTHPQTSGAGKNPVSSKPRSQENSSDDPNSTSDSTTETPADELSRELKEEEDQRSTAGQKTEDTTPVKTTSPTQAGTSDTPSEDPSNTANQIFNKAGKGHDENGKTDKKDLKGDREAAGLSHIRDNQSKGPCQVSSAFGKEYDCKTTESQLKNFDTTVSVISAAAGVGAQAIGAQASYNAQKSGSVAGGMEAGANAQDLTAKSQLALGAISAAAGAWEVMKIGGKHSNNEDRFKEEMIDYEGKNLVDGQTTADAQLNQYKKNKGIDQYSKEEILKMSNSKGTSEGDHGYLTANKEDQSLSAKMINNEGGTFGDLNEKVNGINDVSFGKAYLELKEQLQATDPSNPGYSALKQKVEDARQQANQQISQRENDYEKKIHDFKKNVRSVGSEAASEQSQIATLAKSQGYGHLMQGAAQMIQGYAGMKAAELNKKSAQALKNMSDNPFNFVPPSNTNVPVNPGDALAATGNSISPTTGSGDTSGADSTTDNSTNGLSLGDPTGYQNEPNTLANPGPGAPNFKPGDPGGGPSGGGSGGGGGGSTSTSNGGGEEAPAPRLAESRGVPAYEGGGAYRGGGGSGGGGKDGPDLSGLLAQFLPKQGEDPNHKNGILDYGGGRAPATENEETSLLDRNINIFERVHQAYQEKQKKRRIGI